jgi:hypothetical protein
VVAGHFALLMTFSPPPLRRLSRYFEGEGYSDRNDNRINLGDAWLVVGKVNLRF